MAVLQKIRNKAGIFVIIFVGVALFLFIVDPTTFQVLFQGQSTTIAKINKEKIDYNEYQGYYNYHNNFMLATRGTANLNAEEEDRVRQLAWNDILQNYIYIPNMEDVGINISEEELEDMLYGSNIHYIITQNFSNPETGILDTAGVISFFNNAENDERSYIIAEYFKKAIIQDKMSTKYNNMVAKGFYTPTVLAEMDYKSKNNSFDFEYVQKRYTDIADENVQFTDADLKKYYSENDFRFYEGSENREIEYVIFDILPSSEDSLAIKNELNDLYNEFNELIDGKAEFANRYNENKQYDAAFFISENELPNSLPEGFFNEETGTTSDIIADYDSYLFASILDVSERPDSVNLSQIVFLPNDSVTIQECKIKADSIKDLAEKGEDFSLLAYFNSNDENTKTDGGNIGWQTEKALVNPDVIALTFNAKINDVFVYETGVAVFVIKVTDQTEKHRKIKLATISKTIRPSLDTENRYYADASVFAANSNTGELFDQTVADKKLAKRMATIRPLDNRVSNIDNARQLVKWAYEKDLKIGNVSAVFDFPGQYIVAKLSSINNKGTKPFEKVKKDIETIVIKDKKAEMLIADFNKNINANTNLADYGPSNNAIYNTANNFNFGSFSVPGIGVEPNINGIVTSIEENKISSPIKGNNGVFVLKVTKSTPATEKSDYTSEQLNLMRTAAGQIYRINEAIEKRSNIEDFRVNFF